MLNPRFRVGVRLPDRNLLCRVGIRLLDDRRVQRNFLCTSAIVVILLFPTKGSQGKAIYQELQSVWSMIVHLLLKNRVWPTLWTRLVYKI
ncbi:hypothetical protein ACFX13_030395 [Malus domestica]